MKLAAEHWQGPTARLACACTLGGCMEVLVKKEGGGGVGMSCRRKGLELPTLRAHLLEVQLHRRTEAYRAPQ